MPFFLKIFRCFVDDKLNFKSHNEHSVSKISNWSVGILSKLRFLFNSSTLFLLYYSFVHSHLIFGIHLCGSTSHSHLFKLQKLQNKAIRIITNTKTKFPLTTQFFKLRILKVLDLYNYEIAKIMHQLSIQIAPAAFPRFSPIFQAYTQDQLGQLPTKIYTSLNILHSVVKNLLDFKDQKFRIPYL